MKKPGYTEQQIAQALRQVEQGTPAPSRRWTLPLHDAS